MSRAATSQSNQVLPPVDDNGRGEVNCQSSHSWEKSRQTDSVMIVEGSSSFDNSSDHTENLHHSLVRSSGGEMEGNGRGSFQGSATFTTYEAPNIASSSVARVPDSNGSSVTTTRSQSGQAIASLPMTGRESNFNSTHKVRDKCEETKYPRTTGDSNAATGTTEGISHLIKVRDDMIAAKYQEVLLLSRQNQSLREGMDAIETEMASLHCAIETKDGTIQKLRRETECLRREIKRLQIQGEERRGEENAMGMAAAQNNRLLKLLEQEEFKREGVLRERDEALAKIDELKYRVGTSDKHHAERTAGLELKLINAIGEKSTLTEKYTRAKEQLESLEADLETTKKQATFEREISKTELNGRRQGHYKLLSQLQETRDEVQQEKDYSETVVQDLVVYREQSAELERRLATVQTDLSIAERRSREQEVKADEDARLLDARTPSSAMSAELFDRLSKEISLTDSLQDKVANMSRTTLRLAQRLKDLQSEISRRDSEGTNLPEQAQQAESRELRLQQKVIRLESQLDLEATQKHLHSAIETFNSQARQPIPMASSEANVSSRQDHSQGTHSAVLPVMVFPENDGGIGGAVWSRRQILWKYLEFFKLVSGYDANAPGKVQESFGVQAATELDMSECGLEDEDIVELMNVVRSCPLLTSLNMSMNYLGDRAAAFIADAFRYPTCGLKMVDLRYNQMSMEGVRKLAKALEGRSCRDVTHVYVHREGRINALRRRSGNRSIREVGPKMENRKGESCGGISIAIATRQQRQVRDLMAKVTYLQIDKRAQPELP